MSCSGLRFLGDFDGYIAEIRVETDFNDTRLLECQHEICSAIFGDGNADISGIGVSIGYCFEVAIGFLLASLLVVLRQTRNGQHKTEDTPLRDALERIISAAFDAFFDCAIYFALAVELASVVMLVQKDYGLSTRGFGAADAQIALANSVVCVLPLLYYVGMAVSPSPAGGCGTKRERSPASISSNAQEAKDDAASAGDSNFRLLLFCLVTVMSLYCFYSQVIHNWGASRVGNQSTLASNAEWKKIEDLCYGSIGPWSVVEDRALAVFELVGGLVTYLFTLWQVAMFRMRQQPKDVAVPDAEAAVGPSRQRLKRKLGRGLAAVLLLTPLALSLPLLWGIFRLRQLQAEELKSRGIEYMGNEWAFGQIIGVVIFAPVATQAGYAAWVHGSPVWRSVSRGVGVRGRPGTGTVLTAEPQSQHQPPSTV